MNELLIGLLSALVATNPPAAVSNLVHKKSGLKLELVDPADPVERVYQRLMNEDDAAEAEVDQWIQERLKLGQTESDVEKAAFRLRIQQRFAPVRKGYEEFLEAHPNHARARVAYGSFLNDIGDEDAAEAQWEKARSLEPGNPATWNNLANHFGHAGKAPKAFEYYAKAIELDPNESLYYQNLATMVFMFRQDAMQYYRITEPQVFDKAMTLYRQALARDPGNFNLAAELAQTYYGIKPAKSEDPRAARQAELKLADEAIAAWTAARELARSDREREGIHLHFARWQINTARFEEARRSLDLVTNEFWAGSKKPLLKKLASREAAARGTNAPTSPPAQPAPRTP